VLVPQEPMDKEKEALTHLPFFLKKGSGLLEGRHGYIGKGGGQNYLRAPQRRGARVYIRVGRGFNFRFECKGKGKRSRSLESERRGATEGEEKKLAGVISRGIRELLSSTLGALVRKDSITKKEVSLNLP